MTSDYTYDITIRNSLKHTHMICLCQVSLNPVQVMSAGAEEEKAETARLVCDIVVSLTAELL